MLILVRLSLFQAETKLQMLNGFAFFVQEEKEQLLLMKRKRTAAMKEAKTKKMMTTMTMVKLKG